MSPDPGKSVPCKIFEQIAFLKVSYENLGKMYCLEGSCKCINIPNVARIALNSKNLAGKSFSDRSRKCIFAQLGRIFKDDCPISWSENHLQHDFAVQRSCPYPVCECSSVRGLNEHFIPIFGQLSHLFRSQWRSPFPLHSILPPDCYNTKLINFHTSN